MDEAEILILVSSVFRKAMRFWISIEGFQIMVLAFGVSVVLIFSILYIWKHVKEARP